jgi:hypothetical protein
MVIVIYHIFNTNKCFADESLRFVFHQRNLRRTRRSVYSKRTLGALLNRYSTVFFEVSRFMRLVILIFVKMISVNKTAQCDVQV